MEKPSILPLGFCAILSNFVIVGKLVRLSKPRSKDQINDYQNE